MMIKGLEVSNIFLAFFQGLKHVITMGEMNGRTFDGLSQAQNIISTQNKFKQGFL